MSSFHNSNLSWAERITQMLDELCELLSDYEYGNATKSEIVLFETKLYEFTNEYVPRILPDLDDFYDYIHDCLRNNLPMEEQDIEDNIMTITRHLFRGKDYTRQYLENSDEQNKYEPEIASSRYMQRSRTERECLHQIIMSEDDVDDEQQKNITIMTYEAKLAAAKARTDAIVNHIIQFMSKRKEPVKIELIYHSVPGATHQLIKYFRTRKDLIDYKDKLILGSNLPLNPTIIAALKDAVQKSFVTENIHTGEEIYRQLSKYLRPLLENLYINNSFSLFSLLQYLFPNDFVFVRPRIGLPGQTIAKPLESITQFIYERDQTSINELAEFINISGYDITLTLSLINKLPNVILINRNTLVPRSSLIIHENQLKEITDLIGKELRDDPEKPDTLAIRDLTCITDIPKMNYPITEWLIYSILTKWDWPGKKKASALYASSTSPYIHRAIPIVSTNQMIEKETRQAIAAMHEGQSDVTMTTDDLTNLDDLIEDEIEYDWDLEALEEEDEKI